MDKIVMDKTVEIGLLFSFYRNMITERQAECIELYYNEDLSLSEISEHLGITRQGVRDNIKRGEHVLFDVESKLGLAKRFLVIQEKLSHIDDIIREIEQSPNIIYLSDDIKRKINEILLIMGEMNEK